MIIKMELTHKRLNEMKSCKNKSTFCCQMGIQSVALLLGLAFLAPVNCNLEGDILNAQRTAWNDPNNVLQSWDPTLVNPCTWFHVTCNGNNSIVRVDLGNAGISGPLIPELGGLTNLQYLELYGNNMTGVIPAAYGNLTNLVSLDLYNNSLTGQIPHSLGHLKSLRFLRLNGNKLSGYLPRSVLELVVSGSINILDVSNNYLAGTHRSSKHRVTSIIQDPSMRTPPFEEP